ncbi:MAG: TonB-dependent receptor plug domain-containing protein [Deltaproteobacteria bacterium]
MLKTSKRCLKFIVLAALVLPVMPGTVQAADNSEKELSPLALYFDESQLVEVTTRSPKPIPQVAENVSIVTAEEIERMHAHTVNEINNASGGDPSFNFIPIEIVKRIEIIKGPASSAWGSALGGVINIITKDPGTTTIPKGSVIATYGEAASRELAGEAAGAVGIASYYLHAGTMKSDGLKFDRFFDRDTAYGKFRFALPGNAALTFAGGYSDPYFRVGNFQELYGITGLGGYNVQRIRHFWGTAYLDLPLAERWNLHFALQRPAELAR